MTVSAVSACILGRPSFSVWCNDSHASNPCPCLSGLALMPLPLFLLLPVCLSVTQFLPLPFFLSASCYSVSAFVFLPQCPCFSGLTLVPHAFIPALLFSPSAFLLLSLCLSASTFLNLPLCLCLYSCLFIFYLWHLCSAFNCYSVSAFAFLPLVFLLLFLPLPFCLYLL